MSIKPLALVVAACLGAAAPLAVQANAMPDTFTIAQASAAAVDIQANPFYAPSTLPYFYPAFDKIKDADYAPAFEEAMRQQRAEIDAIAANPEPATFDNTIVAMERSGQMMTRVANVFFNLAGANTNDTLQAVQREMAPKLSAHSDAINLNGPLFARVQSLYDKRDALGLDAESKRLLERYHTDFVRAGAKLSDADKETLKKMNSELAELGTTFSQNVLKEVNDSAVVVDTKDELKGLSEPQIAAAAKAAADEIAAADKALADAKAAVAKDANDADAKQALADAEKAVARAAGMKGKYVIKLLNTSGQPANASLENRALRERLAKASLARGSRGNAFDNTAIVARIARLRAERATLLGYPDHATYVLEDETAKTTKAVNDMMAGMAPAAIANARKEAADLQKIAAKDGVKQIEAWDWSYYTEKVRAERYAFDESQLKPYFEMKNVLVNGVFYAATQLYGITFKERKDLPVYDPDVLVYEVFDHDGEALGVFLVDWYARSNKRGGAWMNAYVDQSGLFGLKPVVANHLNIPKPPAGEPTLLTWDEVTTAFHEFGHALHGMFSDVKYPRFAGTNVPRDFVEYPSQVNEMWADWPSILENYAKHYQTGAPMPKELLDKVQASSKFNQGFATSEYLAAALLDQRWHQMKADQVPGADGVMAFEAKALKDAGVDFAPVPPRYRTPYFSHVWGGGYSAGYYAYLWSEVLDADSVEWFKQNGGLTRKNGDHFRATLLSRGGAEDAITLFKGFSGREPNVEPLLIRRGLK
jgi:peptidyl-dipeptidase Dcp